MLEAGLHGNSNWTEFLNSLYISEGLQSPLCANFPSSKASQALFVLSLERITFLKQDNTQLLSASTCWPIYTQLLSVSSCWPIYSKPDADKNLFFYLVLSLGN